MKVRATRPRRASHESSAAARPLARVAVGHGPSQQALRTRLGVRPRQDRLEREADHAADAVVTGQWAPTVSGAPAGVQRKCAPCEAEEQETIRRAAKGPVAPAPHGAPVGTRAAAATRALSTGGQPLGPALRRYFEPRFGVDLSAVRVHTDRAAARAADALDARAFTLGSRVAFASGAYDPASREGQRLLAHELTHVVQQTRGAEARIQRQGREGSVEFEESVMSPARMTGGVYRGNVRRRVIAPAAGRQPRQTVHEATVPVEFNPTACSVRLPHRYAFVPGEAAATDICEGPPPRSQAVSPVSAARIREIQTTYLRTVNEGLTGWYTARLGGEGCESPCAGREMAIRPAATLATGAAADTTITVANRSGRADAGTICAPDFNTGTTIHEAGHQVLGAADEYEEDDPRVLARAPQWGRRERVFRADWSRMGEHHSYGRFALFNERHFAHVPAFLKSIFPGCEANLVEVSRPVVPDFRFGIAGGYASLGGTHGGYFDLGFELGFPLSRLREWEMTVGPHGRYLGSTGREAWEAFLVGARLGVEHRWTPSAGGFRLGGFAEAGAGWFRPPTPEGFGREPYAGAPYGELGLTAGYRTSGATAFSFGLEAAAGSTLTEVPAPLRDLPANETSVQWARVGLQAGLEW